MRLTAVLLVCGMLAFTGCFGKNKDNTDDTTPTPTAPTGTTTTPTATGATPTTTPTSGGNTTPTTPAALPPKEVCTVSVTQFAPPPGPPGTAQTPTTCTVPAGYKKLTLSGNFTLGTAPAAIQNDGKIDLLDPTGTSAGSCTPGGPGPVQAAVVCSVVTTTAAAGDWKVQPSGTFTGGFSGSVVAS